MGFFKKIKKNFNHLGSKIGLKKKWRWGNYKKSHSYILKGLTGNNSAKSGYNYSAAGDGLYYAAANAYHYNGKTLGDMI